MLDSVKEELADSTAKAVDYRLYHDPEIFALEQRLLFQGQTWNYLGLEAELPNPGDFRTTTVGETPVVLTRAQDGTLHAWVNRCAHKGSKVCRTRRGNQADGAFVCVYHQWAYDSAGNLVGVPFRRGLKGVGGYPADFTPEAHALQTLRVESVAGMVFGTLDATTPPLAQFLGDVMTANIRRVLNRPIRVLGYARQYMAGNWKFYSENSRDSYHGGLLHLFYPTFGIYRHGQDSQSDLSDVGYHGMFTIRMPKENVDYTNFGNEANREIQGAAKLQDPRVIEYRPDMQDGITLSIQSLFPSVVLQQIQNTLATRQVVPLAADRTELLWTFFGYADDDEDMLRHRLRNINLVGPAGLISMEDGEAVELCQTGTLGAKAGEKSFIEMGGADIQRRCAPIGMDENAVRGFWNGYFSLMKQHLAGKGTN